MSQTDPELVRAQDLAQSIALAELVRLLIGEIAFHKDRDAFRARLKIFEETAVKSLSSHRHFPNTNDYTETFLTETACGYVSRLIASIRHPTDPPAVGP